jgi:hypothetical protein
MVPAVYADNENEAEDDSAAATADCDDNDVDDSDFLCFGIAANDIDVDIGRPAPCITGVCPATEITDMVGAATSAATTTDSTGTGIQTNPLFNPP